MSLIRWEPFTSSQDAFDRLLPQLFGSWPRISFDTEGGKVEWRPRADISETDDEFLIHAELPAVKKEDVKVTFDDGLLTIEGERKQETEEKNTRHHRVERLYGSFARTFSLPENINANAIRCESKDGVLTVHVPKSAAEKSKPKQIKVD